MKEAARSKLASEFPSRIVDQSSETRKELLAEWLDKAGGEYAFKDFIKAKVSSGEWEQVWKRVEKRLMVAYRRTSTHARNPSKP